MTRREEVELLAAAARILKKRYFRDGYSVSAREAHAALTDIVLHERRWFQ